MATHILNLGMWGTERAGLFCNGDTLGAEVTPAQALPTEGTQPSTGRQSQVPIMGPVTAPKQRGDEHGDTQGSSQEQKMTDVI